MIGVRSTFLAALVLCLAAMPATATTPPDSGQNYPARDDGVRRDLIRDQNLGVGEGGKLGRTIANVMVEAHGECRWLDNNNTDVDYFVPTGAPADWAAFIANAPGLIRIDNCCPPATVALESSDGQQFTFNLDVGRENSPGDFGLHELEHTFEVTDSDTGATWNEVVRQTYVCENKAWTGQAASRSGGPGGWFAGDWGACSADCEGVRTRSVVCKDASGTTVADSMCGGGKPSTSQACGDPTCEPVTGNCKTYIQSITNHPGCSQATIDHYKGQACTGPEMNDTQDLAKCTIVRGCACEESIYAGCFVDTKGWDSFSPDECTSTLAPTEGDIDGNRSVTFSVGTHFVTNPYGQPTPEMVYFPNNTGRYQVLWSGDCTGTSSACGGVAPGDKGRVELNTSVRVIDTYLDKEYNFTNIRAEVNTMICGYGTYPPCPGDGMQPQ